MLVTVADLVNRWDARLLAQLARDDGQLETNLASNPRISAALRGAEGQLRAAILKGGRYSIEELEQLDPEDLEFYKDIVCNLAMLRLAAARVNTIGGDIYKTLREDTQQLLRQLESGEMIFASPRARKGSLPEGRAITLAQFHAQNLLVDRCTRFYPPRVEETQLY